MKAKKQIKDWLSNGKPYEEGLHLLDKYSKNRNLQRMLRRIHKPEKLEYELRKISRLSKPAAKKIENQKAAEGQQQKTEQNFLEILHKKSVKYDELPNEMKQLYDDIKKLYKERSEYHTKAKLLTAQGADENVIGSLVKKIKEADKQIRINWDKIDNYEPGADQGGEEEKGPITNKRISANRKYISSNKSKLEEDPEKWVPKIQERVDELIQAGESFKPEIVEELKSYGVKL